MSDEILGRLRRLHQYTADLNALMASVNARTPSEEATGTDPSGAVRVTVGADGLPTVIRVESVWQHRVEPQDLGRAVTAALQDAVAEAQRAWSEGFDSASWLARVERIETRAQRNYRGETSDPLPKTPLYGQPRDNLALTEDVLKALQAVRTSGREQPASASGRNRERTIFITLSPAGLQEIEIAASWAQRVGAAEINSGLSEALGRARSALHDQVLKREDAAAVADTLARETLATLAHLAQADHEREER
ncbi:hypothetical protein B5D80_09335 [Micromonospora wenchangensis]|uniref:YbaB/EbfC family DNA-binding protein n=1 Tax=Micromonospora wenchangensis TaxID=1185415 RepID=A0A246RPT0_9ACTN|nr:YbaB/EbfC family nucleoid-associated protein [Micromonospora wenchangensis]OWV09581.1 hypothetical protein B5D80_09335 [Micromonospora wenchangensis]